MVAGLHERIELIYIRIHEGWLYLCVVIGLFTRRVVGRSALIAHGHGPRLAGPARGHLAPKASGQGTLHSD